jgi:hypothetical protein
MFSVPTNGGLCTVLLVEEPVFTKGRKMQRTEGKLTASASDLVGFLVCHFKGAQSGAFGGEPGAGGYFVRECGTDGVGEFDVQCNG